MSVCKAASIREAEEKAVKGGISFLELMKTAGVAAAKAIKENFNIAGKQIAVVCGVGNNGGDGFVCASELAKFASVDVIIPFGEPKTENARHYFSLIDSEKVFNNIYKEYDFIIDAIFGIGLNRELDEKAKNTIKEINKNRAVKISIDIPSGINCDTGEILGEAVDASLTITFIARKPCFLLPPALNYCGRVIVKDIGIKPEKSDYNIIAKPVFEKRKPNCHKGNFGTGIMFCGSYGMCGAAILSARGALRSGIGILKGVICDKIYAPFTSAVPEAVCIVAKTAENGTMIFDEQNFSREIVSANAILIGCGLGNNQNTKEILVGIIKNASAPIIIDADGINILSQDINIIKEAKSEIIITPHPAEMARLCKVSTSEVEANRIFYAKKCVRLLGATVVLKGANTIVCSKQEEIFFNITGNAGMATGGSGDVLSGIILGLLSQGLPPLKAACYGVYIHGEAGDKAAKIYGEMGMIPSDIINNI